MVYTLYSLKGNIIQHKRIIAMILTNNISVFYSGRWYN